MADSRKTDTQTILAAERKGWPTILAALALASLVCGVFWPILGFEFVNFDTEEQVVNNRHVHGLTLENLKTILTSRCITSYYPVRSLSYAIDYQLWGLRPGGFKLTNGLLHLANVLLVFSLVRRLLRYTAGRDGRAAGGDVPVAAFCAGLFAVHPVVVEPVAWVPGREELLMTLGTLACTHCHLSARRRETEGDSAPGRFAFFLLAAFFCLAACLSNAAAAIIPLLITSWDLLTLPRPRFWRILRGTALLWIIGAATVVLKGRDSPMEAIGTMPSVFSAQWVMLIVTVYLLNLGTLIWPAKLGILYEWVPSCGFRTSQLVLGSMAIGLTLLMLWRVRRRPVPCFGLLWFCIALAPHSQLLPHHIARADRFLYLPLVGILILLAAAIGPLARDLRRPVRVTVLAATCLTCLVLFCLRSVQQLQTWQNSYTMWENCLKVSPVNPMAHRCFADILFEMGHFDKAIPHYRMALRVEPDNVAILSSFAKKLATADDVQLRDYDLAVELAEHGCQVTAWKEQGIRRALAMACTAKATHLMANGNHDQAEQYFRRAIEAYPQYDVPLFNLAMLLATRNEQREGDRNEAVALAERGCQLIDAPDTRRLSILAAAYAAAARFDMAIKTTENAIQLAHKAGDSAMAEHLQNQREAYRNGTLYRELP